MQIEHLKKEVAAIGLGHRWQLLEKMLGQEIRLTLQEFTDQSISIGQSQAGGKPHVPDNFVWPTDQEQNPLDFIAQINCSAAHKFDPSGLLPKEGLISFFYSSEQPAGFDPQERDKFSVFYFEDTNSLRVAEFPENFATSFNPMHIIFSQEPSLPSIEKVNEAFNLYDNDEEFDLYATLRDVTPTHKMFGYANEIDTDDMALQCELIANDVYCGDTEHFEHPQIKEFETKAHDWHLLLQIDSDDEAGFMWGDVGRIYFWIRKQDLSNRNFGNVWVIMQCT